MELTYENVTAWFDNYFETVNKNMGSLKTVPNIGKLFTDDFTYNYYTLPSGGDFTGSKMSREELIMGMVHPSLEEKITPKYYAINLKERIVVVRFEDQTIVDGELISTFQASAHYTVVPAADTGLKICLLEYWTSNQTPEAVRLTTEAWLSSAKKAFEGLVFEWLKSRY
jgi:hypothetical protein